MKLVAREQLPAELGEPWVVPGGIVSLRQLESNLDFLTKELSPKARLIPGHGPVSTRAELAAESEALPGSKLPSVQCS